MQRRLLVRVKQQVIQLPRIPDGQGGFAAASVHVFTIQVVNTGLTPVILKGTGMILLVIWLNDPSKMESLTPLTDRNAPLSHSLRREQREGGHARDEREQLGSHLLLWSQLDTIAQSF